MQYPELKYRAFWKGVNQMKYFDSVIIDYVGDIEKGTWGIFIPLSAKNKEKSVYMGSCEVMPFIGIRDKNEKDIYAGDIILGQEFSTKSYSTSAKRKRFIGVVKFNIGEGKFESETRGETLLQYSAGWNVEWEERGNYRHGVWDDFFDCEVIGNIYENLDKISKELLNSILTNCKECNGDGWGLSFKKRTRRTY